MCCPKRQKQHGITFVEMVVSILVIAISVSSVFLLLASTYRMKNVNLVQVQARMLAQYHLDRLLAEPYPMSGCQGADLEVCHYYQNFVVEGENIQIKAKKLPNYRVEVRASPYQMPTVEGILLTVSVSHPEIHQLSFAAIKVRPSDG